MAHSVIPPITSDLSQRTLSQWAVTLPAASRIFQKHGLDFCCQGNRPLVKACAEKSLSYDEVLGELLGLHPEEQDFSKVELSALIDHVIERFHQTARLELPDLIAMATRVEKRHGERPGCPVGLAQLLEQESRELLSHMNKEEMVLFPLFLAGQGFRAHMPVQVMEAEHQEHGEVLKKIRELTGDLRVPEHACATWRALYLRLIEFERDLMEHVAFEQTILFPRGLDAGSFAEVRS